MNTKKIVKTGIMAALTIVGAYIIVPLPFSPVPITLQTFFVLFSGRILGKKHGALSQIIYLLIGIAGLPVFAAGTGGIGILLGPTGGFLLAFPAAAWTAGYYTDNKIKDFFIYLGAAVITYLIGCSYFIFLTGTDILSAVNLTILPFLPGDILKITVLITAGPVISRRLK
ncbi:MULTISPECIES: biotin transporter BioY [unclassified Halanaerobium]|uniref:biotin transporter BioY n=1 Tax=unclassified Halanaerobium TaxID=2641197 RepID=UPI000DF14045|nr:MULTISPECIES: biotin transporter BioY [unclassified Halanaerobium]RCW49960.1 biotin transport system substrate-specific component [Halanaerobium sp. MA284_MarDTE_T2]RCW81101.1 biotin transport system substrate-specific component [Halanaerobium sp. DL-01]